MSKSKFSRRFSRMTSPPAIFPRVLDRDGKDSYQSAMMTAKREVSVISQDLPDCISGIERRRSIHARLMVGASPPQCYPKIWPQAIHPSDSAGSADALEEAPEGAQEGPPRNVRPLWNDFKSCLRNTAAGRFVWSMPVRPTSMAIWSWATPGPQRTREPGG